MGIVIRVRDVMDTNVFFIEADRTCMDAVKLMIDKGVWSLVVTERGLPVGVITERDIIRRVVAKGLRAEGVKVGDVMSSPIITIGPDEPIGKAMELMIMRNVRRVFVVEGGKIIGRVTQTGAFRSLFDALVALSEIIPSL